MKIWFFLTLFLISFIPISASKPIMPELQMLTKPRRSDTTANKADSFVKTTSDSAKIISPVLRSIISDNFIPVEVVPVCPVDSVCIFVRHSTNEADTLGIFHSIPYKGVWNCENISDQDQIHLQFGYTLFHKSGIKIISPPLAHRWVLDRNKNVSRKKYHSYQNVAPDTSSIDGIMDQWKNAKMVKIGDAGKFKVLWSGSHIFFAAHIMDSSVTYRDYTEIHFDLYNDKSEFAGINHRSIRFGPKSRSNCFTVNLTDSGFILADSVNVLISREMRWARRIDSEGYSIEVSLPVFVLSDLQYPGKSIGFDVTVINVDEGSEKESFTSWAGSSITNRYNPSQWGNLVLLQAMYPLRFAVITGVAIFLLVISVLVGVHLFQYYKSRDTEKFEDKGNSPFMIELILALQKMLSVPDLSLSVLASGMKRSSDEIEKAIQEEMDCTFEQLVRFHKVKLSRNLLGETEFDLEKIAEMTGFRSVVAFTKFFTEATCTDPLKYRERKRSEEPFD